MLPFQWAQNISMFVYFMFFVIAFYAFSPSHTHTHTSTAAVFQLHSKPAWHLASTDSRIDYVVMYYFPYRDSNIYPSPFLPSTFLLIIELQDLVPGALEPSMCSKFCLLLLYWGTWFSPDKGSCYAFLTWNNCYNFFCIWRCYFTKQSSIVHFLLFKSTVKYSLK